MHKSLVRRDTTITCHIYGNPAQSLRMSGHRDLVDNPRAQQIWYTNSRLNAQGSLLNTAQIMLDAYSLDDEEENKIETIAHSFTGEDGVVMKSWTMTAFTSFGKLLEECIGNLDVDAEFLSLIQILTTTPLANPGISSNDLMFGKHLGLLTSMCDVLQEMGRVNQKDA